MLIDSFHWHGPTSVLSLVLLHTQLWNIRRRVGEDQQQKGFKALQNLQNWKAPGFIGKGGVQRTQGWLSLDLQVLTYRHRTEFSDPCMHSGCAQCSVLPSKPSSAHSHLWGFLLPHWLCCSTVQGEQGRTEGLSTVTLVRLVLVGSVSWPGKLMGSTPEGVWQSHFRVRAQET